MSEIRRVPSKLFIIKDDEVICPKPQRSAIFAPYPELIEPVGWQCNRIAQTVDEAGFEILSIFFSKSPSFDCSPPYFCGSPPSRSSNPLIHDVQFPHERISPASSVFLQHNFQFEPAYKFSPLVQAEGFVTSGVESRCSVSARA